MGENVVCGKPKERNWNLDLVKVLACIAVVGLHTLNLPDRIGFYALYHSFGYAIPCFFMASGYMLLNKKEVSWKYVINKILRIFRFVVLWIATWYVPQIIWAIFANGGNWSAVGGYVFEFIISIPMACLAQKGSFSVFWYMGATIILYLLLPFLFRLKGPQRGDARNRLFRLWITMLVISVAIQGVSMWVGYSIQQKIWQTLRLWCTLQYFLIGGFMPGIVKWLNVRLSIGLHAVLMVLTMIASVAFRIAVGAGRINTIYVEYFYDDPLFIAHILLLFSLVMRMNLKPSAQRVVSRLAPLTMGVYSIHVPTRGILRMLIQPEGNLEIIIVFAACVAISFVLVAILKKLSFAKYWIEL